MHYPKAKQKLICLAVASACAAITVPGYAQEASTAKLTDANSTAGIGAIDLLVAGTYVSAA